MAAKVESKGTGVRTTVDWVTAHYGEASVRKMLAGLSAEHRHEAGVLNSLRWYDAAIVRALFVGVAITDRSKESADAHTRLRELGQFIAKENVNAVYRFFFNLAKPSSVASILPKMWGKYFRPVAAKVVNSQAGTGAGAGAGAGRVELKVDGVGIDYLAPIAEGWMEYVYELVGAAHASVRERSYAAGVVANDKMIFDIEWRS